MAPEVHRVRVDTDQEAAARLMQEADLLVLPVVDLEDRLVGVITVKGGDLFVSASVRAAEFLRLPRVVIGSTLVSLATTSPETGVSVRAGFRGEPELALGNAHRLLPVQYRDRPGCRGGPQQIEVHPSALRVPSA